MDSGKLIYVADISALIKSCMIPFRAGGLLVTDAPPSLLKRNHDASSNVAMVYF